MSAPSYLKLAFLWKFVPIVFRYDSHIGYTLSAHLNGTRPFVEKIIQSNEDYPMEQFARIFTLTDHYLILSYFNDIYIDPNFDDSTIDADIGLFAYTYMMILDQSHHHMKHQ